MKLRAIAIALVTVGLALGCGGSSGPAVDPDTDEFDLDEPDQTAVDEAAATGEGAEGTYSYDDQSNTLTITIKASSFSCGIETGVIVANVVELTATTMVWTFPDEGGSANWTRVDNSTEVSVVGVWHTDDPNLYAILSADGTAQIFGEQEVCDDERARNGENCLEVTPGMPANLAADGDSSEWTDVDGLSDAVGDQVNSDDGADLIGLQVAYVDGIAYVYIELASAPSITLQGQPPNGGQYRLTVRAANGYSEGERIIYDPLAEAWTTYMDSSRITVVATATGFEAAVDLTGWAGQEGFDSIQMVMVDVMNCDADSCWDADNMDCAWAAVP